MEVDTSQLSAVGQQVNFLYSFEAFLRWLTVSTELQSTMLAGTMAESMLDMERG